MAYAYMTYCMVCTWVWQECYAYDRASWPVLSHAFLAVDPSPNSACARLDASILARLRASCQQPPIWTQCMKQMRDCSTDKLLATSFTYANLGILICSNSNHRFDALNTEVDLSNTYNPTDLSLSIYIWQPVGSIQGRIRFMLCFSTYAFSLVQDSGRSLSDNFTTPTLRTYLKLLRFSLDNIGINRTCLSCAYKFDRRVLAQTQHLSYLVRHLNKCHIKGEGLGGLKGYPPRCCLQGRRRRL